MNIRAVGNLYSVFVKFESVSKHSVLFESSQKIANAVSDYVFG